MQVKAEDLVWFHKLTNQTEVSVSAEKLRTAAKLHQGSLLQHFHILDSRARPLHGRINGYDDSAIAETDLSTAELTTAEISYRLSFDLPKPEPWLTFKQDFGSDNATVPAMMELDVHHLGVRLDQPVNLPGDAPHWIRLDWANGPPSPPRSLAEIRQRKRARHQKKLGLVDDLGVYSFIHIGFTNVRHELLLPLWKWRTWAQEARPAVEMFCRTNTGVRINGQPIRGRLARVSLHPPSTLDLGTGEQSDVDANHARVAVVLDYDHSTPLKEIRLEWRAFSKAIPFLKSMILAPGRNPTQTFFTNERRSFVWRAKSSDSPRASSPAVEEHWGHRHEAGAGRIIVHEIKASAVIRALQN